MNRIQANVLIAGPESEARILKIFTPGATVAATPEAAIEAIDSRPYDFDLIIAATTFSDGSEASGFINHADSMASRLPDVLLFSADPDALAAQQRAIPGAKTILLPIVPSDFKDKLQEVVQKRT